MSDRIFKVLRCEEPTTLTVSGETISVHPGTLVPGWIRIAEDGKPWVLWGSEPRHDAVEEPLDLSVFADVFRTLPQQENKHD